MPPAAGAEANVSVIVAAPGEQLTPVTVTGESLISDVKSKVLTVLHASGSLNVAATALLPAVAETETKVGAVVSTVKVRVMVGDDLPPASIARKLTVCGPSGSGAVGLNVQLVAEVPQRGQLTPAGENGAVSTFASMRATALLDAAVPE